MAELATYRPATVILTESKTTLRLAGFSRAGSLRVLPRTVSQPGQRCDQGTQGDDCQRVYVLIDRRPAA
jgi:hypothetical protein